MTTPALRFVANHDNAIEHELVKGDVILGPGSWGGRPARMAHVDPPRCLYARLVS